MSTPDKKRKTPAKKLNLSEHSPEEIAKRVLQTPPPKEREEANRSAATEHGNQGQ